MAVTVKRDDTRLVEALVSRLSSRGLVPGEASGRLEAGDMVIEVEIKIRHAVDRDAAAAYRARAVEVLRAEPSRAARPCGCDTAKKSRWSQRPASCAKSVSVCVVVRHGWKPNEDPALRFVCAAHADHVAAAADVLASFPLPKLVLDECRREVDRRQAAADARRHAEEQIAGWLVLAVAWLQGAPLARDERRRCGIYVGRSS